MGPSRPPKNQLEYCVQWTAIVAAFNAVLVVTSQMEWPWALALSPLLGIPLGRQAQRRAVAAGVDGAP